MRRYIAMGCVTVLVGIDQLIKYLVVTYLKPIGSVELLQGVFELRYLENRGAAFGILQQRQIFLILITSAVIVVGIIYIFWKKVSDPYYLTSAALIISGGIGNLIDRACNGFVVDYLYFSLIDFPIFNFADCCVVVGTILFISYIFITDYKASRERKQGAQ